MAELMDPTAEHWFDDPDEVVAFARWYYNGSHVHHGEVIDLFEKPWKFDRQHQGFVVERASTQVRGL